jgi:hypothetical protein
VIAWRCGAKPSFARRTAEGDCPPQKLSGGSISQRVFLMCQVNGAGASGKPTQYPLRIRGLPRGLVLVIMIALWPICATGFVSV